MQGAKVVLDSISDDGDRLTTVEAVLWRPLQAELNTHRVFSRNSASSRAIPLITTALTGTLDRVSDNPAFPVLWPSEQPGMVGGAELIGGDLDDAQKLFKDVHNYTIKHIKGYLKAHEDKPSRLHKAYLNRLLEPFMWQTCLITATEWENFFNLRVAPDAQHELMLTATAIKEAMATSKPKNILPMGWHKPYITEQDWNWVELKGSLRYDSESQLKKISSARCARISTMQQDGSQDCQKDINLCDRLIADYHASPMEHVATPDPENKHVVNLSKLDKYHPDGFLVPKLGNFLGWTQFRHEVLR